MSRYTTRPRIVLVALAVLLALPMALIASPVEAKKRPRTVTRTFRNHAAIDLPTAQISAVSADLYPSTIAVEGLRGPIRDVNLRLNGFSHTNSPEVYVLLVGPSGQTAVVMALVGDGAVNDATLRLDDDAASQFPRGALQSGTFRPANAEGDDVAFNPPAPEVTSGNAALSVFDGANPNGTWRLFVMDTYAPTDPGIFADGWALEITTKAKARKRR
jgi:subtilisin-like proprotein convertase family protein